MIKVKEKLLINYDRANLILCPFLWKDLQFLGYCFIRKGIHTHIFGLFIPKLEKCEPSVYLGFDNMLT